jgi:hypothetical protein
MNWTVVLGSIAGIAGIFGGVLWLVNWVYWRIHKTPIELEESVEDSIRKEKQFFEDSGRPKT